jgi:hypothetical protein
VLNFAAMAGALLKPSYRIVLVRCADVQMWGARRSPRKEQWRDRNGPRNMESRAGLEGRQVKCLIASEGHLWMRDFFDRLPTPVRQHLRDSNYNICPVCMDGDAHLLAAHCNERKPSIRTYLHTITIIESKLRTDE